MKKKKIISAIAGLAIVASVAAGSYAYFTSREVVQNNFTTSTVTNPKTPDHGGDTGVDVHEHFDHDKAGHSLPGEKVTKQVDVENTATYAQYIKVQITKSTSDSTKLPLADIQVNLNNANVGTSLGQWAKGATVTSGNNETTTYYFVGAVAPGAVTSELLSSVNLADSLTKVGAGVPYNVTVTADTCQATSGALTDLLQGAPSSINATTIEANSKQWTSTTDAALTSKLPGTNIVNGQMINNAGDFVNAKGQYVDSTGKVVNTPVKAVAANAILKNQ